MLHGGNPRTARARVRGGLCRAGPRHHARSPGGDIAHESARDRRRRTSRVWEPLNGQARAGIRRECDSLAQVVSALRRPRVAARQTQTRKQFMVFVVVTGLSRPTETYV